MTAMEIMINRFLWRSTRREKVGMVRRILRHYGQPVYYTEIPPRTQLALYRIETALGARGI